MSRKNLKKEAEIYIHIPFCEKKCDYCDFLSFPMKESRKMEYITVLKEELKSKSILLKEYQIVSVFFGGGTPSSIASEHIMEVMELLHQFYSLEEECEITIEINPGIISQKKLEDYKLSGINRISFGLQSAMDKELENLGRIHTFEEFRKNFLLGRRIGFSNINVDLMWGIPEQTIESYQETLDRVLELGPEHISAYSLILEEGTPFYKRYVEAEQGDLPEESEERKMYEITKERLKEKGYFQYEISNYGKEGFFCQHNIGYWKRKNYIGFGLGASSLFENRRWKNEEDFEKYVEQKGKEFLELEVEELSLNSQMEECMFLGLRMMEGVSKKEFLELFHIGMDEIYQIPIEKGVKEGLLLDTKESLQLTLKGVELSNRILSEFLL